MRIGRLLYNAALPLAALWARVAALFDGKIAEGIEARKGLRKRWLEKSGSLGDGPPIIWFHVSSVGEFLQARPVIDGLRRRHGGGIRIALTFFSPSGMNYYERSDRSGGNPAVVFTDYLPVDTPSNARFCLGLLDPDAIVYVKFDLWPNLIIEAHEAGVPQVLISGTLSPDSKRLRMPAARFYGELYSRLDAIAAISDEDAERFGRHLSGGTDIVTAGDTRFDQVCERIDSSDARIPQALSEGRSDVVIAGSTWPPDESLVIPAFAEILGRRPGTRLVIAPHEPLPSRLSDIEGLLDSSGLGHVRLSALEADPREVPVVIADGIGYLAELYRVGTVSYVGGSWTTGVHNVMEPAVLGLPVFFGPKIRNSREAVELTGLEAGRVVETPGALARGVLELLEDRELLREKGEKGRRYVRDGCGAASRCIDLVEKLAGLKRGEI